MKNIIFKFNTRKKGLKQLLGDLEYKIMETVWEQKKVTVRNVQQSLKTERNFAYTTIMTVMSRLVKKGILIRKKRDSSFEYQAVLNKDDFISSSVRSIMGNLLTDFTSPAINQFVELLDEADPEKMEELAQLIEEKRRRKNA